jgi:hypothetical protein
MDEVAQRRWSDKVKIGIHSATGCCNIILSLPASDISVIWTSLVQMKDRENYVLSIEHIKPTPVSQVSVDLWLQSFTVTRCRCWSCFLTMGPCRIGHYCRYFINPYWLHVQGEAKKVTLADTIMSHMNKVHILLSYSFMIIFNIIFPSHISPSSILLSDFLTNSFPFLSCVLYYPIISFFSWSF